METERDYGLLAITGDIVSAFVGKNAVRASELPNLIASVHSALQPVGQPEPAAEAAPTLTPAVSIKKSVTDEYLISLENGKSVRSLKWHLQTANGMTPEQYRAKWGLPRDYPMVAPGYAAKRSALAKASGLGVSRRTVEPLAAAEAPPPAPVLAPEPANNAVEEAPVKRRVGRPKKARASDNSTTASAE